MKVVCQDATMKLYGLTQWKVYDAELTPTMYDPNTFAPSKWYVVKCDDGMERKFTTTYFITLQEWRERQINKLL